MPGHEAGIVGFLDEEAGVPAQDIGPEQVLHRIQYPWMTDHLVDPGKQHVAAMAHLGLARVAKASNDAVTYKAELDQARELDPQNAEIAKEASLQK